MNGSKLFLSVFMYGCFLLGGVFLLLTAWGLVRVITATANLQVVASHGVVALVFLFLGGMVRVASSRPSFSGSQATRDKWKQW
jgi:hypothetical protein